ncbi:uncharacterized protein CYBJADRAFT_43142 [Cyberlindnera jadinii NRRL Y-1542]|uniref:Uncharacterized protein n=1 Tax=Cyberlindnera jadinii (strain ATCC 18201 / CBS 1600 / BCRC 20928 / JCM 3617 / NBRC 0987 / NRRL Y-1542) TaxID=983966 RepID=A0A1E4S704_CYBJN|nr:hypothetical protein CYBJADRAFT_43142 [Cyberlindnera jadinii NRRL Y-1542]ODV75260.1 hypothetical protein CYBJADRAFT_43142 [Cyberlindnera jadinii NRRL Y-1542]
MVWRKCEVFCIKAARHFPKIVDGFILKTLSFSQFFEISKDLCLFFLFQTNLLDIQSEMLPAGVILVFVLVGLVGLTIFIIQVPLFEYKKKPALVYRFVPHLLFAGCCFCCICFVFLPTILLLPIDNP